MKIGLIIAAGGHGSRMNSTVKKQYIDINGIPVLVRSICAFSRIRVFNQIIVVIPHEDLHQTKTLLQKYSIDDKQISFATGGADRRASVYNGLLALDTSTDVVVVHDAARPLVSENVIKRVLEGVKTARACCPAVPVKDTIKKVDAEGWVEQTLDRCSLWAVQTPQAFKYRVLLEAHLAADANKIYATDDCGLVEQCGVIVKIVPGDYSNIKITTPEDVLIAEALTRDTTTL